jgi:DNA polymerase sigma
MGVKACQFVSRLITTCSFFKPVMLVLKKILLDKGLNSPYYGGLSSFSLVLMSQAFYKMMKVDNEAQALLGFLDFYGNHFDPNKLMIFQG